MGTQKKISQVIPGEQVEILTEALNLLEVALKSIALDEDSNLHHKLFDTKGDAKSN